VACDPRAEMNQESITLDVDPRSVLAAIKLAKQEGVEIRLHSIIYELIDQVREAMAGLLTPILKEKLFWIYTYDQHSRIFPMAGVPSNPGSFFALPDSSLPSGASCNVATGYLSGAPSGTNALNTQTCTLAARLGYSSYSAGVTAYDNGISALNTAFGMVPRAGYQEINTPKLDWQISPKEHLSLLAHRLRWVHLVACRPLPPRPILWTRPATTM